MRRRPRAHLASGAALTVFFALFLAASSATGAEKVAPSLDSAVDAVVALMLDGPAAEYREVRTSYFPARGEGVAIAFFTIEGFHGGNNYTYYMAAFEPEWNFDPETSGAAAKMRPENVTRYRLVGVTAVGGKGWRDVDFKSPVIEAGRVVLKTVEYARTDPMCCPSRPATATWRIGETLITEVKPDPP